MSSARRSRSVTSSPLADHPQLCAAATNQLDDLLHALGICAQAPDDQLFGFEVRIGPDRDIWKFLFELSHQRIEARLDRKGVSELLNCRNRTAGQELRFELFGEDPLQLQRHAGQ